MKLFTYKQALARMVNNQRMQVPLSGHMAEVRCFTQDGVPSPLTQDRLVLSDCARLQMAIAPGGQANQECPDVF